LAILDSLERGEVNRVQYKTTNPAQFKIPHGLTLDWNILQSGALFLSYTKVFGNISLKHRKKPTSEKTDLIIEFVPDNITVFGVRTKYFVMDLGIFTLDINAGLSKNHKNVLGNKTGSLGLPSIGGDPILPILRGGFRFPISFWGLIERLTEGSTRLVTELSILPIPMVKTGVIYDF